MDEFQKPVKVKDVAEMSIEEKQKAAFIFLCHLEEIDTPMLVSIVYKALGVLEGRIGSGKDWTDLLTP